MQELEIYLNDQRLDIIPDDSIGLTFQIAKLGELQFIQANASTEIEAPLTKNNIEIFEHAQNVNNQTNIPYRLSGLKVKSDGVWIIQNGSIALNETEGNYKITLYSGNEDIFAALEDLNLRDLDLSTLAHNRDLTTILANLDNTYVDGFGYPVVDYGDLPDTGSPTANDVDVRYQYPVAFVRYLFELILAGTTYTLDATDIEGTLYDSAVLPIANNDSEIFYTQNFIDNNLLKVITSGGGGQSVAASTEAQIINLIYDSGNSDKFGLVNQVYENTLTINFTFTLQVVGTIPIDAFFVVRDFDTASELARVELTPIASPFTYTVTADVTSTTTNIGFYIDNQSASTSVSLASGTNVTTAITPDQNMLESFGKAIDPAALLPDISQLDFIKTTAQMFGAVFQSNNITRTLTVRQFDVIGDNTANALDWSSKIDWSEKPRIEYRLEGYARKNYFTFENDDAVFSNFGRGLITIDDDTLEPEADIIESPYAASISERYFSSDYLIAIVKIIDDTNERTISIEPRILYVVTPSASPVLELQFTDGTTTTGASAYKVGKFIDPAEANNIAFSNSLLTDHYETLSGVLTGKTKQVTLYLRLNALDIQNLDFFKPVYLNVIDQFYQVQINGYFYIDKIEEYLPPYSSEVTLVKLGL